MWRELHRQTSPAQPGRAEPQLDDGARSKEKSVLISVEIRPVQSELRGRAVSGERGEPGRVLTAQVVWSQAGREGLGAGPSRNFCWQGGKIVLWQRGRRCSRQGLRDG